MVILQADDRNTFDIIDFVYEIVTINGENVTTLA
jgi:hypothetical protein